MSQLTSSVTSSSPGHPTAGLGENRVDDGQQSSYYQSDNSADSQAGDGNGGAGTYTQLREQKTDLEKIQVAQTTAEKLAVDSNLPGSEIRAYQEGITNTEALRLFRQSENETEATLADVEDTSTVLTSDRREQIDTWVEQNAETVDVKRLWFDDHTGGENVADAYNGETSLGELSPVEVNYLAGQSLTAWQRSGNTENLRESGLGIEDAETRAMVADAYAQPSVQRFEAEQIQGQPPAELTEINEQALQLAIELDAAAVIEAHEGFEGALGSHVNHIPSYQNLLNAVGSHQVDVSSDGVSRMVTAIFLKSPPESYYFAPGYAKSASDALSVVMVDASDYAGLPSSFYHQELDAVSARFEGVLQSSGGINLIADSRIAPELRGWAITQIAQDPSWNINNLEQGWESAQVSQAFSQPIMEQYLGRGTEPQALSGEALRNTVGQALGIPPDMLPTGTETALQMQERLDAGLDHQYYGPNETIDGIVERLTALSDGSLSGDSNRSAADISGTEVSLSIMPVVVTGNDFGAANFNVFKVEASDGTTHFVEDINPDRSYDSVSDWQSSSQLPPGRMTYAEGMDWNGGNANYVTENTAAVTDSFGEWARKIGDGAALVVGVGAGIALVVGTGGTAAIVAGLSAGAYSTARAGERLYDAGSHGQDLSDLSDAQIRGLWLDAAAGTLSFGAMGAASSASRLVATGSRFAPAALHGAAGLQLAANSADVISGSNQALHLANNWDNMSAGERATGLLGVAFWGGMTAAGPRLSGSTIGDTYSFTRLRNNIEFGTPFAQATNHSLQPGEMRVVYETAPNGRATNLVIEYGPGTPSQSQLDLHVRAARQMDAAGGMRDRLGAMLGGYERPSVGSAGWEAQIEIRKIEGEQRQLVSELAQPGLTVEQQGQLQVRMDELDSAINDQVARLEFMDAQGQMWIASPSRGAHQAAELNFPEAPDGHVWVHGGANDPHLRRIDGAEDKLFYDRASDSFSTSETSRPMERVGQEGAVNDLNWETNAQGETIRVTGTLREFFRYATRSSDELSAQAATRTNGIEGDHAGHIIGHRFALDQGLKNMFPQDANLNTSAYKTLENELADWISLGAEVDITISLNGGTNGRPGTIDVEYSVYKANEGGTSQRIYTNQERFTNGANQSFDRLNSQEMRAQMVSEGETVDRDF